MQNSAHIDRIWIGPASDALRTEPLDALTVIYDRRSGQTHVVSSPVPEILAILGPGQMTTEQVLTRLQAQFDLEESRDAAVLLDARLMELAALGLVQVAP